MATTTTTIEAIVHQDHLPVGIAVQKQPYTVRVRRWAEIIEENRKRLHFYREHLDYEAEDDLSIEETLPTTSPRSNSKPAGPTSGWAMKPPERSRIDPRWRREDRPHITSVTKGRTGNSLAHVAPNPGA